MKDAASGNAQGIVKLLTEIVGIENAIFRIIISPAAV